MADNVQSAMFDILKRIQADMASFRAETAERFEKVDRHFGELREIAGKHRRDIAGLLVIAKSSTGHFAEELAAVEERVRVLEAQGR